MTDTNTSEIPVVVTTSHKGIFFGYMAEEDIHNDPLQIWQARMCMYFSSSTHGVVGLAADGPKKGSRVSPAAPYILLHGITAIMLCTSQAVTAWEKEPWDG